ncbi:hypothetical protein [Rhodobacter lacus]|uniref:Uncharacterized protein n=1 Tax=Rhodobacter lacus TaxID=1641972 RepID=A0ABW5A5G5_9RHOB
MLTPLPAPAVPTAPGSTLLPLPQGAGAPKTPAAPIALAATVTPQAAQAPPGAAPSAAAALANMAPAPLPTAETALAGAALSAADAAAASASTASPSSLVTAQMIGAQQMVGAETAPLQAMLAQQAATRALPHPPHRSEPRRDGPAKALDHAPTDTFDPHTPHLPLTLGNHGKHAQGGDEPAPGPMSETEAEAETSGAPGPRRHDALALHPPPLDPRPSPPSPWGLVGAAFTTVFILSVLLLL